MVAIQTYIKTYEFKFPPTSDDPFLAIPLLFHIVFSVILLFPIAPKCFLFPNLPLPQLWLTQSPC